MTTFTAEQVAAHCNETMETVAGWVQNRQMVLPIDEADLIRFLKENNYPLRQLGRTIMLIGVGEVMPQALKHAVTENDPISFLLPVNLVEMPLMIGMERPDCIIFNMKTPTSGIELLVQAIRRYPELAKIAIVGLDTGTIVGTKPSLFDATYPIITPVMELLLHIKALIETKNQ